jgi:hypothetical protein
LVRGVERPGRQRYQRCHRSRTLGHKVSWCLTS